MTKPVLVRAELSEEFLYIATRQVQGMRHTAIRVNLADGPPDIIELLWSHILDPTSPALIEAVAKAMGSIDVADDAEFRRDRWAYTARRALAAIMKFEREAQG